MAIFQEGGMMEIVLLVSLVAAVVSIAVSVVMCRSPRRSAAEGRLSKGAS